MVGFPYYYSDIENVSNFSTFNSFSRKKSQSFDRRFRRKVNRILQRRKFLKVQQLKK